MNSDLSYVRLPLTLPLFNYLLEFILIREPTLNLSQMPVPLLPSQSSFKSCFRPPPREQSSERELLISQNT